MAADGEKHEIEDRDVENRDVENRDVENRDFNRDAENHDLKNRGLLIDCSRCPSRGTPACDDCLVAYILDRPEGAIVFDVAEERALRALREGGLLPDVKFGRRTG